VEEFLEKLAEALDEETPICADTVLFELETWDSLGALAVAAMAKEAFGVTLHAEDIAGLERARDLFDRLTRGA
jgi:acyl carrier protein